MLDKHKLSSDQLMLERKFFNDLSTLFTQNETGLFNVIKQEDLQELSQDVLRTENSMKDWECKSYCREDSCQKFEVMEKEISSLNDKVKLYENHAQSLEFIIKNMYNTFMGEIQKLWQENGMQKLHENLSQQKLNDIKSEVEKNTMQRETLHLLVKQINNKVDRNEKDISEISEILKVEIDSKNLYIDEATRHSQQLNEQLKVSKQNLEMMAKILGKESEKENIEIMDDKQKTDKEVKDLKLHEKYLVELNSLHGKYLTELESQFEDVMHTALDIVNKGNIQNELQKNRIMKVGVDKSVDVYPREQKKKQGLIQNKVHYEVHNISQKLGEHVAIKEHHDLNTMIKRGVQTVNPIDKLFDMDRFILQDMNKVNINNMGFNVTDKSCQLATDMYSQLVTDKSSKLVTDMSNQLVTDMSNQLVTDNSSQLATDMSTQLVTDKSSQLGTDKSSQLGTDMSNQLVTDKPGQLVTKMSSQLATDKSTQLVTDKSSQLVTDMSSQLATDKSSQLVTDKSCQLVTDMSSKLVTDKSGQLVTDMSSQLVTDKSCQLLTDLSSQLVTDMFSQLVTDESSQLVTDKSNQLVTDMSNQLVTDKSGQLVTDKSGQLVTDMSSQLATDKSTQLVTDKSSQLVTDMSSQLATDKSSKSVTDKSCQLVTDKSSQLVKALAENSEPSKTLMHIKTKFFEKAKEIINIEKKIEKISLNIMLTNSQLENMFINYIHNKNMEHNQMGQQIRLSSSIDKSFKVKMQENDEQLKEMNSCIVGLKDDIKKLLDCSNHFFELIETSDKKIGQLYVDIEKQHTLLLQEVETLKNGETKNKYLSAAPVISGLDEIVIKAVASGKWSECKKFLKEHLNEKYTAYEQLMFVDGQDEDDEDDDSFLHTAANFGYTELFAVLYKNSDSMNFVIERDFVSHIAAQYGHKELIEFLLSQGLNIESKDRSSWTLLHEAAYKGHVEVAELLLQKGCNKEAKSKSNNTPLHIAAIHGHKPMIQLLVNHGCDKIARNNDRHTAYDCLKCKEDQTLANLLKPAYRPVK